MSTEVASPSQAPVDDLDEERVLDVLPDALADEWQRDKDERTIDRIQEQILADYCSIDGC
jgi:hypothetical protein